MFAHVPVVPMPKAGLAFAPVGRLRLVALVTLNGAAGLPNFW